MFYPADILLGLLQAGIKVWEAVLAASGDEAFGLHAGQQVTTSLAGLGGHMMERSKNLYEASMALQQYLPLANEMVEYRSWIEAHFLVVSIGRSAFGQQVPFNCQACR